MRLKIVAVLDLPGQAGDGFSVSGDEIGQLAAQDGSALPLRRLTVNIDGGRKLTLVTNDLDAPAHEIARLYKQRWEIELLFRWIKQHLKIRTFLGRSENAIRIQILAAMIAFLLLRIAARNSRSTLSPIRFAGLVRRCLFARKPLARLDKPPEVNPSKPKSKDMPGQMELSYA